MKYTEEKKKKKSIQHRPRSIERDSSPVDTLSRQESNPIKLACVTNWSAGRLIEQPVPLMFNELG